MEIDFNAPINNLYGTQLTKTVPDPEKSGEEIEVGFTLGHVVVEALLNNEQGMEGKVKISRYALAMRIHQSDNGLVELNVKEAATAQKQVVKLYPPLVVGQAHPLLEGKPKK